jgi:L-asparaginase
MPASEKTNQGDGLSIRIIVTGGTFDKKYDEIEGILTFKETQLPQILRQVRATVPIACETSQLVDSLHMTIEDRLRVLSACQEAPERQIIVTHGTDTMVETAQILGEASLDKTIVFTGAMVPYSVFGSDALFNLGCSVSAVQLLSAGVYIAMNGRIFTWDGVQKDLRRGVFVEKASPV